MSIGLNDGQERMMGLITTTDSTQHGHLPRTENDGGKSWKRLRSSQGLAHDGNYDYSGLRAGHEPALQVR